MSYQQTDQTSERGDLTSATDTADLEVMVPLWRVRLSLAWKNLKNSWVIFAENPIGLIGLGIIVFFALFAIAHPILMRTVWDRATYHPVHG